MNPILLLEPPYADATPWLGRPPAVGAVALIRLNLRASARIVETFEEAPWLVPCVVLTPTVVSPAALQVVWGLPSQPAFVIQPASSERLVPATLLVAVAARPAPTVAHLVSYVIDRTRSVALGETLDGIWSPEALPGRREADRTVRYRLGRLGAFGHHDWLRIERLIRAKTTGGNQSAEEQAHLAGTEARTLRAWVARYLECSMTAFRSMAGWEWILETVLRRGGYSLVGEPPVDRARRALPPKPSSPAAVAEPVLLTR